MGASEERKMRRTRKLQRSLAHQSFQNYIGFGAQSTACMGCFLTLYALVMVCILPMLHTEPTAIGPLQGAHIPLPEKQQERLAQAASNLRAQFRKFRQGRGVSDESLLNEAIADYQVYRAKKQKVNAALKMERRKVDSEFSTPGVIVLGMHRSGTSMLAGLLVHGIGYHAGGPLIGAAFDNAKGFFERIDIVLQNDEFMQSQRIWWADGVRNYDAEKAYQDYKRNSTKITFAQGARGLDFLNDPSNAPWLQKDPRMCITLKTWLHLLDKKPAILFTYRHPLEVAMSLKKREKDFKLEYGLRLWIIYNMRALQNSADLCRVLSSNDKILEDPLNEVQRIADELTAKCGMPPGPTRITQDQVDKFIDPNLQHNKKQLAAEAEKNTRILAEDRGCKIKEYLSDLEDGSPEKEREMQLYQVAMRFYCDLKSGIAYKPDYAWPELPE